MVENKIRAFIVGLARNCESQLPATLDRLSQFSDDTFDVAYCIVTNDSIDRTEEVLRDWAKHVNDATVINVDGLAQNAVSRTARIAIARNIYISELRRRQQGGETFELLMVCDLDGVNAKLVDNSTVLDIFAQAPRDWVALFANQRQQYYDVWALREQSWCAQDCWDEVRKATRAWPLKKWSKRNAIKRFVLDRQIHIPKDHDPISVTSAFGGFGVYKIDAIGDAKYLGLRNDGEEICEHVSFNQAVSRNGGLYIIPALLNDAPHEHVGS